MKVPLNTIDRSPYDSEIEEFENLVGNKLPNDYIKLLKISNGGIPTESLLRLRFGELYLQAFYPLKKEGGTNLFQEYEIYGSSLRKGLITIGTDGSGGNICLDLKNGKIYLEDNNLYKLIAKSIVALMNEIVKQTKNIEDEPEPDLITKIGASGDISLLDKFVATGGDINIKNNEGETIGQIAAKFEEVSVLKKYIEFGGSLSGILHAVMKFTPTAPQIDFLLGLGVDPEEKDNNGKFAYEFGMQLMRDYLKKRINEKLS